MPRITPQQRNKKTVPTPKRSTVILEFLTTPLFARLYVWFSLAALLTTTLYWAYKSAVIQLNNADQLVDPYFFTNSQVFHATQFPSAHSFLIKWPLFYLIKLFDFTGAAYNWSTVALALLTVAGLVLILRLIERRPLYLGTLILALASVLLFIPATPYAGALLPVNIAMLTTRNIEYLLYIGSLVLIIRATRLLDWRLGLATLLQILLFASDKLFLAISLGGAIVCLFFFALDRSWKLVVLGSRWLFSSLLAAGGGLFVLWLIDSRGLTHMVGDVSSSPYSLIETSHGLILGFIYALAGLLTNFGANPAYDVGLVRQLPHQFIQRFFSLSGIGFLINLLLLVVVVWALISIVGRRFRTGYQQSASGVAEKLVFALLASTVAALALFVATSHYYFVDSRYLTIGLFTFFITTAVWLRQRQFKELYSVLAGVLICLGLLSGFWATHNQYRADNQALADINQRNLLTSRAIKSRPEQVLVGDYWRVLPIKFMAGGHDLQVLPMANCTQPRTSLTSTAWNLDLANHSFAYLLPLDSGPAGFPVCSLQQINRNYGRPNASTVIAGSISRPKGLLLFYDHGVNKPRSVLKPVFSAVQPINLADLPQTFCRNTTMNIVAHQDDDLLFINPDVYHSIQNGDCLRTIYLTAGDAGVGSYHWLSREKGSEAAYDEMSGIQDNVWAERVVKLADNQYITVDSPHDNPKISLIFFHLPDGNLNGQGFKQTGFESLAKLDAGNINSLASIDGQSSYTKSQLVAALNSLMQFYQPNLIRTQANYISKKYPDHSDHMATGRFVKHALAFYDPVGSVPVKFYIGYPERGFPPNVSATDIRQTFAAFLAYAAFDNGVCRTVIQCDETPTYGSYITREYTNPY